MTGPDTDLGGTSTILCTFLKIKHASFCGSREIPTIMQNAVASDFPFAGIVGPPVVALAAIAAMLVASATNAQINVHSLLGFALGSALLIIVAGAMLFEFVMLVLGAMTLARQPHERTKRNLIAFMVGVVSLLLGAAWLVLA